MGAAREQLNKIYRQDRDILQILAVGLRKRLLQRLPDRIHRPVPHQSQPALATTEDQLAQTLAEAGQDLEAREVMFFINHPITHRVLAFHQYQSCPFL